MLLQLPTIDLLSPVVSSPASGAHLRDALGERRRARMIQIVQFPKTLNSETEIKRNVMRSK